jgi:uncharacterized protein (DUF488 family)
MLLLPPGGPPVGPQTTPLSRFFVTPAAIVNGLLRLLVKSVIRYARALQVMRREIFTIGYEGAELAAFLSALTRFDISLLIDVRELPLSRKRGFSKRALGDAVAARDIGYMHFKELGDPKPGREAARRGDYSSFRLIFARRLKEAGAIDALGRIEQLCKKNKVCLMCFERSPEYCHRAMIAAELSRTTGMRVRHLQIQTPATETGLASLDRFHATALG